MPEKTTRRELEYPFGQYTWLSTAFVTVYFLQAAWLVANRAIIAFLSVNGAQTALVRYAAQSPLVSTVVFSSVLLILSLLAARMTDSLPCRGAFLLNAGSALILLSGVLFHTASFSGGIVFQAGLFFVSGLLQVGLFLLLCINREIKPDARAGAAVAAVFHVIRILCHMAAYFCVWKMEQSGSGGWYARMLAYSNTAALFVGIAVFVASGMTFWLMRTPVRAPQYPPKKF